MDTKEALLQAMLGEALNSIETNVTSKVEEVETQLQAKLEGIKAMALDGINSVEAIIDKKPFSINLGTLEKPKTKTVHSAFKLITKILASAKRKEKNIMMVGEAGSGKTQLAANIAEALKLDYYPMSVGLQTTKSDLLGFINAQGNYVTTPIRKAYENGGVLLLDEFDAAHAGVVTILNSLLANGHCSFPDKIVEKNPNFICICACNTYGRGGNISYVGRNRLDAATLDRFIVVDVGYDNKLEKLLTKNDSWNAIIKQVRKNINKQGIKMIVSPRASMDGADLLEAGFKPKDVFDMVIAKGCDDDTKKKLMEDVDLSSLEPSIPEPKKEPKKEETRTEADVIISFDYKEEVASVLVNNEKIQNMLSERNVFIAYESHSKRKDDLIIKLGDWSNYVWFDERADESCVLYANTKNTASTLYTNKANSTYLTSVKLIDRLLSTSKTTKAIVANTDNLMLSDDEEKELNKGVIVDFVITTEVGDKVNMRLDAKEIAKNNIEEGQQLELEF